jgi:hypothetical protein
MHHLRIVLLLPAVLATGAFACGDDPAWVAGDYTISVTNHENGCNFANWQEGDTTTGIDLMVTQAGEDVTGDVGGATGVWLDVTLGGSTYTGTVDGDRVSMTLHGTRSNVAGGCSYFINSTVSATLTGDALQGEITYRPLTNDHPDCSTITGCVSRQAFNGTRPPQ